MHTHTHTHTHIHTHTHTHTTTKTTTTTTTTTITTSTSIITTLTTTTTFTISITTNRNSSKNTIKLTDRKHQSDLYNILPPLSQAPWVLSHISTSPLTETAATTQSSWQTSNISHISIISYRLSIRPHGTCLTRGSSDALDKTQREQKKHDQTVDTQYKITAHS